MGPESHVCQSPRVQGSKVVQALYIIHHGCTWLARNIEAQIMEDLGVLEPGYNVAFWLIGLLIAARPARKLCKLFHYWVLFRSFFE